MKSFFEKEKEEETKKFLKGVPKRDGSGRGIRANKGRGGCENPQEVGRGQVLNFKEPSWVISSRNKLKPFRNIGKWL